MRIQVRLFAAAREIVGHGEVAIELKEGSTVGDLMEGIFSRFPGLKGMAGSLVFAVNRELAERSGGRRGDHQEDLRGGSEFCRRRPGVLPRTADLLSGV